MDAIKRQGNRSDLTLDYNGPKLSAVTVGEAAGSYFITTGEMSSGRCSVSGNER